MHSLDAQRLSLEGHTAALFGGTFSHDGKRIVTCSADHTAKIWDSATGKLVATLTGHDQDVIESASFSPDGSRVVTAEPRRHRTRVGRSARASSLPRSAQSNLAVVGGVQSRRHTVVTTAECGSVPSCGMRRPRGPWRRSTADGDPSCTPRVQPATARAWSPRAQITPRRSGTRRRRSSSVRSRRHRASVFGRRSAPMAR